MQTLLVPQVTFQEVEAEDPKVTSVSEHVVDAVMKEGQPEAAACP